MDTWIESALDTGPCAECDFASSKLLKGLFFFPREEKNNIMKGKLNLPCL